MPDSLFDMLDPYEANAARTRRRAPTREPDPLSLYASQGGVSWDKFLPSEQRAMQSAASLQAGGDYDPRDVFLGAIGAVGAPAMGPAQGGATLGSGAIKPIRAYHGSPHDFDRFDLSKIGTGEGAQAYGHGLYFAENPAVASEYRASLAPGHSVLSKSGEAMNWQSANQPYGSAYQILSDTGSFDAARKEALRMAEQVRARGGGSSYESLIPIFDELEREGVKVGGKAGRTYEVNINAAPEQFLDWDKPLAGQAEQVQRAIMSAGQEKLTGADAYQRAALGYQSMGGMPAVSNTLREAGIPGIKYLDQGSRIGGDAEKIIANYGSREKALEIAQQRLKSASTGDLQYWDKIVNQLKTPETSNYVLFRDDIIDIVKKYGLAGAAAMYGISQDEAKAAMEEKPKMKIGRQSYGDEE